MLFPDEGAADHGYLAKSPVHSCEIVTCPVPSKPIARAAAGGRSISLPRTQGPRSLMRTVTHLLWQTRTRVPNGNRRWAAVIAEQSTRSPFAVRLPQ